MNSKISEFYIRVVPLNSKGNYRITRRVLKSIYETAQKDGKRGLLQIDFNDDVIVSIEFEFHKNRGYIKDYRPQNSILINESILGDLIKDTELNPNQSICEFIDDDDGIWSLSIALQRRL